MDKGSFHKAKALFEEAAKISKETSTLLTQSTSFSNIADIEYYLGNYKAASKYAAQALEISKEIEDVEGEGINNISLAKINIEQGQLEDAKNYLNAAYKIYSELDSEDGWSDYYYYLAQYYMELKKLTEALDLAQKSRELALKCQNNRKHAKALRLIGILLQRQENYADSTSYFDKSIELSEKEEAAYELTKSLYLRAVSNYQLDRKEAVNRDLRAAAANMKQIDKCKWTKVIEHGIS
jgi:tetratricopeptide (TPR) repeat protein